MRLSFGLRFGLAQMRTMSPGFNVLRGDAVTLETRHAGPFGGVRLRLAEHFLAHDVHPGVRITVLELDDFTLDLDGVGLDVVLR